MKKTHLLDHHQIERKINRLAYQIYEHCALEQEIFIAGIAGNGYLVAHKITDRLKKIGKQKIVLGKIKINKEEPLKEDAGVDFGGQDYKNKVVIVVDDVMNSGKTLIYAVKIFLEKPLKRLHTTVLVDRSHTRFPIKADFVGLSLSTTLQERIIADLSIEGQEVVYLE